jgi:hypothetical protein
VLRHRQERIRARPVAEPAPAPATTTKAARQGVAAR